MIICTGRLRIRRSKTDKRHHKRYSERHIQRLRMVAAVGMLGMILGR